MKSSSVLSKSDGNKKAVETATLIHVNYIAHCCCPGHVSIDIFDPYNLNREPIRIESGWNNQKKITPSITIPLYVQGRDYMDIAATYVTKASLNDHCLCQCCGTYNYCTNNCADAVKAVLKIAGFDTSDMPFFSSACCIFPTCGCSLPKNIFEHAVNASYMQMASNEKIHQLLKSEFHKTMQTNNWDSKRIDAELQSIDNGVECTRNYTSKLMLFKAQNQMKKETDALLKPDTNLLMRRDG